MGLFGVWRLAFGVWRLACRRVGVSDGAMPMVLGRKTRRAARFPPSLSFYAPSFSPYRSGLAPPRGYFAERRTPNAKRARE
jgi:hypothetical protein